MIVYEPGIPLAGAVELGWLDGFQRRLDRGDRRGAFACMVKGAGHAPAPLAIMPDWYVRTVLRVAVRGQRWESISPLLESCLREHRLLEQLASKVTLDRYCTIAARVRLLAGAKSPPSGGRELIARLDRTIPTSTATILEGLDHLGPEQRPDGVAAAIADELAG